MKKYILLLVICGQNLVAMTNQEKRLSRQLTGLEGLQAYETLHTSGPQEDRDTVEVKGYLRTLILSLNKPESGEHYTNIINAYDILKKFANHESVNKQWANSRLMCLALAKNQEKTKERAWLDKKEVGNRVIENVKELKECHLRAIANNLATQEFDGYISSRIAIELQQQKEIPQLIPPSTVRGDKEPIDSARKEKKEKKEKKHHRTPRVSTPTPTP